MNLKSSHRTIEQNKLEIDLEIPFTELEKEFNSILSSYKKDISLPGFRKGKVPTGMILNKFGEAIKAETINKIIPKALESTLKEKKIATYGPPELVSNEKEKIDYVDGQPLKVKISYHLPPSCEIKPIKELEIETIKIKLTDDDLQKMIQEKLAPFVQKEEIEQGHWQLNDSLQLDIIFQSDNESIKKLTLQNHMVVFRVAGVGAYPPYVNQLYDELKSLPIGQEKEVLFPFSSDTQIDLLKNQSVKLKLKINRITRPVYPKIDQKILNELKYQSEEEMKSKLREELETYAKERESSYQQEKLLEAMKPSVDFILPDIVIEDYLYGEWNQMLERMSGGKKLDEKHQKPPQEWLESNRLLAKKNIENQLIMESIKKQEQIEVGESEMDQEIKTYAQKAGRELKDYRRELIKSGHFTMIKNNLISKKVVSWIKEKSKIKQTKELNLAQLASLSSS